MEAKNKEVEEHKIAPYRDLASGFDKILRSIRLYDLENDTFKKHSKDFFLSLGKFLENSKVAHIEFGPNALLHGNTKIFGFEENKHPFHQLYQESLRVLEIKAGISETELLEFLSLLKQATSVRREDSDAYTILWEKEFDHIQYSFAESIVSEADYANHFDPQQKISQILDRVPQDSRDLPLDSEIEEISDELKITLNPKSMGNLFLDKQVLNSHELHQIQGEIVKADRLDNILLDFSDMLLAILIEEHELSEVQRYSLALSKSVRTLLGEGFFSVAAMVVEQILELPNKNKFFTDQPKLFETTLNTFWNSDLRAEVLANLSGLNEQNIEYAEDFISQFPPKYLEELMQYILSAPEEKYAQLVARSVARIHQGDLGIFTKYLNRCKGEQVDRFIYLLSILKSQKVIAFISKNKDFFIPTHTAKILSIIKKHDTSEAAEFLMEVMKQSPEVIRILCLKSIAEFHQPELAKRLLTEILRDKFETKSLKERKAYYFATSKLAGNEFLPFVQKHLKKKNWLGSKKLEEQQICALIALQANASPESTKMVGDFRRRANSALKSQCDIILKQRNT